jgi:hypothetical protein
MDKVFYAKKKWFSSFQYFLIFIYMYINDSVSVDVIVQSYSSKQRIFLENVVVNES